MRARLLTVAAAAILLVTSSTPAHAASPPRVRVTIDAVDLAGAAVAGIPVMVTSSIDSESLTTNAYGRATVRIDITPGETVTATANGMTFEYTDANDRDRFTSEVTIPTAQGYVVAWAQADVDGDTLYDTVWQQVRTGMSDRWLIELTTGGVREVNWGGDVVAVFTVDFTDDPANELVAIEQHADGEYELWVYSELADDEEDISLGALPELWWSVGRFDADAHNDLLFYGGGVTGPWQFTLAYSATQRATSFELGVAGAQLYEETVDIGGDGLNDVVVAANNPDIWTDWWVWDSADRSVHLVEIGLYNGQPSSEGFGDCDSDGLAEFISVATIEGSADRIWTSYEYASYQLYDVTLGPENDRGPGAEHCPPEWIATAGG